MTRIVDLSPQARALADHQRTTGMAVSMGWTCACGFHADNLAGQYEHQAAMVLAAVSEA
jgi:hypothetical protein